MTNRTASSNPGDECNGLVIKTLFIRPLKGKLIHDEILSHFSAFGEVNNVRICNETKHSFGFVKFSLPESAAKALEVDSHLIGGRRVKIVAASDKHQDSTSFDHKTSLLDLNDDCILEILSQKCLSARDLCSATETCRRLKEIASRVFKRENKSCDLNLMSEGDTNTAIRILMHFGSELPHLEISGGNEEWVRETLSYVTEHSTLQSLELRSINIPANFTARLRPLFKRLQKLTITSCTFEGASKELLADCGSLVTLNVRDYGWDAALILLETFPKLQQFECSYGVTSHSLEPFISRHINLKSLKLLYYVCTAPVLQCIANCKQLEILKCLVSTNATLDLSNLGNLRELHVGSVLQNISENTLGLKNLEFLEHLQLHAMNIDPEFIRTLPQLKRLQVLKFSACTGLQNLNRMGDLGQLTTFEIQSMEHVDLDVVLLGRRLSKLNCLRVSLYGFKMDLAKYLRMVDVVRRRTDRSKLTFRLISYEPNKFDHLFPDFSRNAHLVEMIIERFN